MDSKVVLHIDLNNFYASVSCANIPTLVDEPIAVCGDEDLRHGIVLAKNLKAKNMGVKTGQVIWQAKELCPNLLAVPANFNDYLKYSNEVRNILKRYSDKVQPFGIDESWIDLTEKKIDIDEGENIANHIRNTIRNELGLTISVGVSDNKIYSKFGSDLKKPDAVSVISKDRNIDILYSKPICDLLFIGNSTEKKLNEIGVFNIGQLANANIKTLKSLLGKNGIMLHDFACGKDNSSVLFSEISPEIKSIGNSITTAHDLKSLADASITLYALCESVSERLRMHKLICSTLKVGIRYNNLKVVQFQTQLEHRSELCYDLYRFSMKLLEKNWDISIPLRSLGVSVSGLTSSDFPVQLSFLPEAMKKEKYRNFEYALDKIRNTYGHYSLQRAVMQFDKSLGQINPKDDHVIHPEFYSKDSV